MSRVVNFHVDISCFPIEQSLNTSETGNEMCKSTLSSTFLQQVSTIFRIHSIQYIPTMGQYGIQDPLYPVHSYNRSVRYPGSTLCSTFLQQVSTISRIHSIQYIPTNRSVRYPGSTLSSTFLQTGQYDIQDPLYPVHSYKQVSKISRIHSIQYIPTNRSV